MGGGVGGWVGVGGGGGGRRNSTSRHERLGSGRTRLTRRHQRILPPASPAAQPGGQRRHSSIGHSCNGLPRRRGRVGGRGVGAAARRRCRLQLPHGLGEAVGGMLRLAGLRHCVVELRERGEGPDAWGAEGGPAGWGCAGAVLVEGADRDRGPARASFMPHPRRMAPPMRSDSWCCQAHAGSMSHVQADAQRNSAAASVPPARRSQSASRRFMLAWWPASHAQEVTVGLVRTLNGQAGTSAWESIWVRGSEVGLSGSRGDGAGTGEQLQNQAFIGRRSMASAWAWVGMPQCVSIQH